MSARARLHAAIAAALRGGEGLDALTAVFDAPPVRSALPHATIEEAVLADWGTKDMAGREGRAAVTLRDGGERPVRLRALAGAAEDAVLAMPRDLGGGWRIASLVFVRGRIAREGTGWAAASEFRVRMLKED
jgi:hypothetical protein